MIKNITDASFDAEVLKNDLIVITHFWAEWRSPCKKVKSLLATLAPKYASQVKIVNLDIDENPNTTSKYEVLNIPTVLVFKNGQLIERIEAPITEEKIEAKIEAYRFVDKYA